MRARIHTALLTASAAGATILSIGFLGVPVAAGAFAPSGGTPIPTNAACTSTPAPSDNCAAAGYQASGRDFRFAQALVTVPNVALTGTSDGGFGAFYTALDASGTGSYQYARVGVAPCPTGETSWHIVPGDTPVDCATLAGNTSGWVAFAAVTDGGAPTVATHPLSGAGAGDGVFFDVYLVPADNAVQTVITMPNGTTYNNSLAVTGPTYIKAQAAEDWSANRANGQAAPQPPVVSAKSRDTQFFEGRFTTLSGVRGTFRGPWSLNAFEATSNGSVPPAGTLMAQPSYLWTEGASPDGQSGNAFGVWQFPA